VYTAQVAATRDRILRTLTLIFGVVVLPAVVVAVFRDPADRSVLEPIGYWLAYSVWLTTGFLLRGIISYRIRALTICGLLLSVGVFIMTQRGLGSGGELFLCTGCGITTALIGRRAGVQVLVLSTLAIAVVGLLINTGVIPISITRADKSLNPTSWFMATAVFGFLAGSLVVTLGTLQTSLFDAFAELDANQTKLEHLVDARTSELSATNAELEAFAYSVSHDLRAPLRAIDGFSNALSDDCAAELGETGKAHIARVLEGVHRMTLLIDSLLHLSRLTRANIQFEPVDLSAIATEICRELQENESGRRVTFVIEPHLSVVGDRALLRTVLTNLLENSWKFTSDHEQARIEFGALAGGGEREFFVRDDGAGFDMAYVEKLFKAFQRLHGMHEFEGTGIGLAQVQRVVRRHGGRVRAEGAIEKGATVYFTVPARSDTNDS
jgi:signal transduction histidine kinase